MGDARMLMAAGDDDTPFRFDWLFLAWGLETALVWLLARVMRNRNVFLISAGLQLGLAAWFGYELSTGWRDLWMVFVLVLMLWGVRFGHRLYRRFSNLA